MTDNGNAVFGPKEIGKRPVTVIRPDGFVEDRMEFPHPFSRKPMTLVLRVGNNKAEAIVLDGDGNHLCSQMQVTR